MPVIPELLYVLLALMVLLIPVVAYFEFRAYSVPRPRPVALPIDDGPLDYDCHTVPTPQEMAGYSFGDEMLAPVRERLR